MSVWVTNLIDTEGHHGCQRIVMKGFMLPAQLAIQPAESAGVQSATAVQEILALLISPDVSKSQRRKSII